MYWATKLMENSYINVYQQNYQSSFRYDNIQNNYMKVPSFNAIPNSTLEFFYNKMLSDELIRQFILQRDIHFLMIKTTNQRCSRSDLPLSFCPNVPTMDISSPNKTTLGNGREAWQHWASASDNKINFEVFFLFSLIFLIV